MEDVQVLTILMIPMILIRTLVQTACPIIKLPQFNNEPLYALN